MAGTPRRPVRIVQWAQVDGPVGGVTRSVQGLTEGLRADGHDVVEVDTGAPRRAVASLGSIWRRESLHVFHITRLWRAALMAPVFAVLPGRTILLLHSGSVAGQLDAAAGLRGRAIRIGLRAYDRIWVVNADIGRALPRRLRGRVVLVSPFVAAPAPAAAPHEGGARIITVATNSGLAHYNADLAVAAVDLVRRRGWPDARLWVLGYDKDGPQMRHLREALAPLAWATLDLNLAPEEVSAALAASTVFLRPTSWDGDSMIVREALAMGARVVASDVSPRPAGVEIAPLDAEGMAAVILHGGRVSDGAGLADVTVLDAARSAIARLAAGGRGD